MDITARFAFWKGEQMSNITKENPNGIVKTKLNNATLEYQEDCNAYSVMVGSVFVTIWMDGDHAQTVNVHDCGKKKKVHLSSDGESIWIER